MKNENRNDGGLRVKPAMTGGRKCYGIAGQARNDGLVANVMGSRIKPGTGQARNDRGLRVKPAMTVGCDAAPTLTPPLRKPDAVLFCK
ncbi:MAG: hypothetical protein LBS19_07670 [Clostridiales bacterium]|nr:hypothetical protein [Clostridiales bacterium]